MKILEIIPQLPMGNKYTVNVVIEHNYYTASESMKTALSTLELSGEKDIIEWLINGDNKMEFFDLIVGHVVSSIYENQANIEIDNIVFILRSGQLFKRKDDIPIIENRINYYQDNIKKIENNINCSKLKLSKYISVNVGNIVLNKKESKIQAIVPVKVCEPFIDPLQISKMFPKFNSELVDDIYKRYLNS